MKIRKSRLKQIISEEVNLSKFIPVREGDEPSIIAPGVGDFGQDAIAVLKDARTFIDKMIEDNQVYGNLLDSAMARLAGVSAFQKEMEPHLNEEEPDLQEAIVQEIIQAISEMSEIEEKEDA